MRIGIDARLYRQTGVGRYLRNLIHELGILDKNNEYFIYLNKEEYNKFILPSSLWHKKLVNLHWHTLKEQLFFPKILYKDRLDVVHFPYFNIPIFYQKKYLLTIHDLIIDHFDTGRASRLPFLLYKIKRMAYKQVVSQGIKKSSFITTISKTTKEEVINHYHVDADKIEITYDALDNNFLKISNITTAKNYYNFPYMLYVGNAYPHKNLEKLIIAFKTVNSRHKIKLVLAGRQDYFYKKLRIFVGKENLQDDVIFFGEANDKELVNLYTFAKCLVFPSLMEGFGLPNLEALHIGLLPVVSDISVFREIWDDSLIYFDPNDEKDIATQILTILAFTPLQYKQKVIEAKKKMLKFSWKKTAQETLKIYNNIFTGFPK